MLAESIAFVMNVSSLGEENYTLVPGHVLRRATQDEIEAIKSKLVLSGAGLLPLFWLWEQKLPLQLGAVEILPEKEWRYFVIAFAGNNASVENIQTASDLAPLELEIAFTIIHEGAGLVWHPGRLFHVLQAARFDESFFRAASKSDLEEIMSIRSWLQKDDEELKKIKPIADQVSQLKALPHDSPLRFLGYFAVLESLLTHSPKPSDPYDSITRQVKKKIALLDNRWPRRIDYTPFGGLAPEKVWGKMYAYRSLLAHGGSADFGGEFKHLANHELALRLIKETVKAVVRQALIEPRLVLDLRDC